jgi:hypothetical protein
MPVSSQAYDVRRMAMDIEKEQRRLTELYANMPSEQLQQIASQPADLTETAYAALDAEMKRRGLTPVESSNPPSSNPLHDVDPAVNLSDQKLVPIRSFRGLFEAQVAKANLDDANIPCFLADDNMVRMDWFMSDAIGGVKLLVGERDIADALAALDQPIPETFEVDGIGEYTQPRCPQCGSLDVSFGSPPLGFSSLFDSKSVLSQGWFCANCKHAWEDTDD